MGDRLVSLLKRFELRARVFQTGELCRSSLFDAEDGLGYIHVLRQGSLRAETAGQGSVVVDRPRARAVSLMVSPAKNRN